MVVFSLFVSIQVTAGAHVLTKWMTVATAAIARSVSVKVASKHLPFSYPQLSMQPFRYISHLQVRLGR